MDWESVAAGLLHDTVEDTNVVTFESIEKEFGSTVRHIVEGETKVGLFFIKQLYDWILSSLCIFNYYLSFDWTYIPNLILTCTPGIQAG